jgi:hypothetical protein
MSANRPIATETPSGRGNGARPAKLSAMVSAADAEFKKYCAWLSYRMAQGG